MKKTIDLLPKYPVMKEFRNFKAPKKYAKYVKCIAGPIRSGKTFSTIQEIFITIYTQPKTKDGVRYSKWAFIKHELARAKEIFFDEWMTKFPNGSEINKATGTIKYRDYKNKVYAEIDLYGLNNALDAEKYLKSKRYTHAWINEAYLINDPGVIDILIGRVGCFPMGQQGMILIDTNLPNIDHWMYERFEKNREKYPNYYIFYQPSGLSDEAENREHMSREAYEIMALNYDEGRCKRDVHGQYAFVSSGQSVYPKFSRKTHLMDYYLAEKDYDFFSKTYSLSNIIVGCDAGLTPASVYMMRDRLKGIWIVFDEIVLKDESCDVMGEKMLAKQRELEQKFKFCEFKYFLDPAGNQRKDTDANTVLRLYRAKGLQAYLAGSSNALAKRREGLRHLIDNEKIKILRNCIKTIEGLDGGYHYKEPNGYNEDNTKVVKNEYSHVIEALEYGVLGAKLFEEHVLYHKKNNNEFDRIMHSLAGRTD